ncbi:cephalosporin hydroxylase family protein [Undibacterium cyanobacteriorum]|uniref:Cephalosporin hydroxylase family protein n=1 Tax=Undibacterium cyanobacteriorum TaxID=3073561 RepID=A0ABY9RN33_9BURK|nr:cephalosporin hydroxylase family protein [Undibacterium sp. 20NA77.5]WMW82234.1 cephalosporin hydroxylase family protein [Undibacterium sp. 20NA77.5]
MNPITQFENERNERIERLGQDLAFQKQSLEWLEQSMRKQYVYNFSWLGRPIIQNPIDMIAMQEIIWNVQPDLIIETGIAHGGSILFSSSLLELNAACGGNPDATVIGIDIDIRSHNREAILQHPMSKRIVLLEGSSVSSEVVSKVHELAQGKKKVLVFLDSNHTHEHVLAELNAYAPLVSKDSYCVVFDTFVEDVPADVFDNRPWKPGDNPKTAVHAYLRDHPEFEIDKAMQNKLQITVAPDGFLRRIS